MWADGGVGTGEHPPSEVRFEDDNVPPIPLCPSCDDAPDCAME
jgi:hypothetical protein